LSRSLSQSSNYVNLTALNLIDPRRVPDSSQSRPQQSPRRRLPPLVPRSVCLRVGSGVQTRRGNSRLRRLSQRDLLCHGLTTGPSTLSLSWCVPPLSICHRSTGLL